MRSFVFSLLFSFSIVTSAYADICDYYRKIGSWLYESVCKDGSVRTKPAGAASTFSSSFNLNTASLPSEPSSYGLETILSRIRGGNGHIEPNFGLVKGFNKFGAGLSTGSTNTFYGDSVLQRRANQSTTQSFEPLETDRGKLTSLNFGTALRLLGRSPGLSLRLGLSGRYNNTTNTWGGGPGLMFGWSIVSFGFGFTRERVSNFLPRTSFRTYQASVRFSVFEIEGIVLTNDVGGLRPIPILTTTARVGRLMLTAAARRMTVQNGTSDTQFHYAAQYLFSKRFSLGAMFNYIPGTNSLGLQVFF